LGWEWDGSEGTELTSILLLTALTTDRRYWDKTYILLSYELELDPPFKEELSLLN